MKYTILQSGFLSVDNPLLQLPKEDADDLKEMQSIRLGKKTTTRDNPYHYLPEAVEIFDLYTDNPRALREFDFRERVIKSFKTAVVLKTLKEWMEIQTSSPYFTSLHRKYLLDTIRFILGSNREISVESWYNMIEPREINEEDKRIAFKIDTLFESGNEPYRNSKCPIRMRDLISLWLSREDGFKDMLYFVAIVFGNRPGIMQRV